jgi:hypothetical protein
MCAFVWRRAEQQSSGNSCSGAVETNQCIVSHLATVKPPEAYGRMMRMKAILYE